MEKKNDRLKNLRVILFWGALWGLTEASLGYVLHLIPVPGLSGLLLFPFVFFYLAQAYRQSGRFSVLIAVSVLAASIKLLDLFLPNLSPMSVLNPALAILMEALIVGIALKLFNYESVKGKLAVSIVASFGWRILFIGYHGLLLFVPEAFTLFDKGQAALGNFLIWNSLVNAVLIFGFALLFERVFARTRRDQASFSERGGLLMPLLLLVSAVTIELITAGLA